MKKIFLLHFNVDGNVSHLLITNNTNNTGYRYRYLYTLFYLKFVFVLLRWRGLTPLPAKVGFITIVS